MSLAPFILWCDSTALAVAMRESTWLFPFVETLHLLALALLGGSVLITDVRLLGRGLRTQPVGRLLQQARPWLIASLLATVVSGLVLFLPEARKCYESPAFRLKMAFLAGAVLYTFTVRDWVFRRPSLFTGALPAAALVSLTLWLGVGITGRGIGFW